MRTLVSLSTKRNEQLKRKECHRFICNTPCVYEFQAKDSKTELLEDSDDVWSLLSASILHDIVTLPVADSDVSTACDEL